MLRPELHTTAQRAYDEALRAGAAMAPGGPHPLRGHAAVLAVLHRRAARRPARPLQNDIEGSWFTSHINENPAEIAKVRELFGCGYLDSYDRHGLVGPHSVFAHNVHPTDAELKLLAATGASVAHCPTSNAALGSGLFPLDRHLSSGVRVALGSDVGAGTGFSLFKEGLQAYFLQRLRGPEGVPMTSAHLLHLATAAGADALGLRDQVGDLEVGKRFDAVWLDPPPGTPLAIGLRYADGPSDALAKAFALATPHDVRGVWVDGERVKG